MELTWTCDVCGAEHIIEPDFNRMCTHDGYTCVESRSDGPGRTYVDFDQYPSFMANPGSTVHDFAFDEVHEYRRFYRAFTGRKNTPWGSESDSAAKYFGPMIRNMIERDRVAHQGDHDAYVQKMSKEMLGPFTYWAIKITAWVLFMAVMGVVLMFISVLVK